VPKESAWFGSYAPPKDNASLDAEPELISMKQQPLYLEDWIGLRALDEAGRVKLLLCEGEHMQISAKCFLPLVKQYVGDSAATINTPALSVQH
jgi:palmitoyl-protein thioesterase